MDEKAGRGAQEDDPELPITPEWGQLVRRARNARKMTQQELGDVAGLTQTMVSYIENGSTKSTTGVRSICRELGIPLPKQYFEDETEERWMNAGRVLRKINAGGFAGLLAAAEMMVSKGDPTEH